MRSLRLVLLLLVIPALARAQDPDRKPTTIEVDGMLGYTAVQVDKWANRTAIADQDQASMGAALRFMFVWFGRTQVGVELATQQLFTYSLQGGTPGTIVTQETTVAGLQFLVIARPVNERRYQVDFGAGFHVFEDVTSPALLTALHYVVLERPRYSVPMGARVNITLNEAAAALTAMLTAGIAIPLR